MGAWGVNLYQNDVACDVKNEYISLLKAGLSNKEITEKMIKSYTSEDGYEEDIPVFWFALADIQWKYGRLLNDVKKEAIRYIDSEKDLIRWKDDRRLCSKRKQVLLNLREKLEMPQPKIKKVSKLRLKKSKWKIGDLLLYQIKDATFKEHKWYSKYVLFRVVAISKTIIPGLPSDKYFNEQSIVSIYSWVGNKEKIPFDIDKLKFIEDKNVFGVLDDRFALFDFNRNELKKLNFQLLSNNDKYLKNKYSAENPYNLIIGVSWGNINILDYKIVKKLEVAEKNNYLIEDIN